ncbi:ester cyclase [Streptomyces sparsogenes]|uniref:ester cyclase n=1 Tax=Streptomyces sparsogenes TaxID=67365 RepID=UPI00340339CE
MTLATPTTPRTGMETVWALLHECGGARHHSLADRLVTEKARLHNPPWLGPDGRGAAGVRDHLLLLHRAFPDLRTEVEDLFGAGDRIVARLTHRGTHRGPWLGVPATGRAVEFSQTLIFRVEDGPGGRIAEIWYETDALGTLITLGAAPPLGTTSAARALGWAIAAAHHRAHHRVPQDQPWPWRGAGRRRVPAFRGPLSGTAPAAAELLEANARPLRRWIAECVNEQAVHICREIFHETYRGHSPPHAEPEPLRGPKGYERFIRAILTGFPDAKATIEDLIPVGDRVACRVRMTGTHLGPYRGLPPTGRPFSLGQIVICRIEDGRIAESWQEIDALGLMLGFGVVPRPGSGPGGYLLWFARLAATLATAPRRIAAARKGATA